MLRKYSKIIALIALAINIFLAGLTRGFEFHFYKFSFSDAQISGSEYFYISFFLLIFFIGTSVKKRLMSDIICLAALILAIYKYKFIYLFTTGLLNEPEPISLLFQESTPLNIISFLIILILLIYQITILVQKWVFKDQAAVKYSNQF